MNRWLAGLLGLVPALAVAPAAGAPPAGGDPCGPAPLVGQPFGANTNRPGLVDLHFFNAQGATVTYYECVDGRSLWLGRRALANGAITSLWGATAWRCGRRTRRFAATATLPDGTHVRGVTGVRTPSCAQRFRLEAPRTAAAGRPVRVRVVDRWGTGGVHTTLCLTAPRGHRTCRAVAFPAAATVATRRFTPASRGRWRADLRVLRFHVRATIAVGVPSRSSAPPAPTVLATGDSTMQGVDSFLADDLGSRATVLSDVRPGFAMSLADGWAAVAAAQAARLRPAVTVMSLGAAEGFPMPGADGRRHACCDPLWVDEYVRRVGRVMDTYRRGGRTRVLWLTIVAPREPARAVVVSAVNGAILRAAAGRPGIRVLRMDRLFSPDGYQDSIRYRGRDVRVREPDGIHLNVSGTAIAARVVARAIGQAVR